MWPVRVHNIHTQNTFKMRGYFHQENRLILTGVRTMNQSVVFRTYFMSKNTKQIEPLAPTGKMPFETFKNLVRAAMNEWCAEFDNMRAKESEVLQ
jgi:hypothetical protein